MSYIEKTLAAGERIVHIGRFHWIYIAGAFFWIFLGTFGCIAILGAGVTWSVHDAMGTLYPNLPGHLFWQGWSETVDRLGGYIGIIRDLNIVMRLSSFGVLVLGVLLFAHMMIVRATTEIAITTNRFALKEGVIARNVDEMHIDRIESVHVLQSVLGRLLDYGTVMVRGMGVGEIALPPVAHPIRLRKAIETAKSMRQNTRRAAGTAEDWDK